MFYLHDSQNVFFVCFCFQNRFDSRWTVLNHSSSINYELIDLFFFASQRRPCEVVLHALHMQFPFCTFCSFHDVKWPFCSCVDDVSIWWQIFNIFSLSPNRWFRFNSRIFIIHFGSMHNDLEIISGTQSYIFRWRSLSYLCSRGRPYIKPSINYKG